MKQLGTLKTVVGVVVAALLILAFVMRSAGQIGTRVTSTSRRRSGTKIS
jgi:Na+-transporting methylmalonyl-CoA/oxaloacetate decarboxylase gamma subunit